MKAIDMRSRPPYKAFCDDFVFDYESQKKTQSFTVGAANTAIVTRKDRRQHCGCYFENIHNSV